MYLLLVDKRVLLGRLQKPAQPQANMPLVRQEMGTTVGACFFAGLFWYNGATTRHWTDVAFIWSTWGAALWTNSFLLFIHKILFTSAGSLSPVGGLCGPIIATIGVSVKEAWPGGMPGE